jgi:hypothetical protein
MAVTLPNIVDRPGDAELLELGVEVSTAAADQAALERYGWAHTTEPPDRVIVL